MIDSSENSVRRLAEKVVEIITNSEGGEYDHSYSLPEIESLLSEAMEKNLEEEIKERLGLLEAVKMKDARSAAYRDAIEIAKSCMHDRDQGIPYEIADKLRRKSEGL